MIAMALFFSLITPAHSAPVKFEPLSARLIRNTHGQTESLSLTCTATQQRCTFRRTDGTRLVAQTFVERTQATKLIEEFAKRVAKSEPSQSTGQNPILNWEIASGPQTRHGEEYLDDPMTEHSSAPSRTLLPALRLESELLALVP